MFGTLYCAQCCRDLFVNKSRLYIWRGYFVNVDSIKTKILCSKKIFPFFFYAAILVFTIHWIILNLKDNVKDENFL